MGDLIGSHLVITPLLPRRVVSLPGKSERDGCPGPMMFRTLYLLVAALAACAHSPPSPARGPVPARTALADVCQELLTPQPVLADAVLPPIYPFQRAPAPQDPWAAGRALCERLGPQCAAVVIGADGLVDRVDVVFKPEPGRAPSAAARRMLEMVRRLKLELGLSEVPAEWPTRPGGGLRLDVGKDGVGVIDGSLETRPEFGVDWHGSLSRRAVTGVALGEAQVLKRDDVRRRLLGRHYCTREATGEFEVQRRCNPCDPVVGLAESCASACQDDKVEKTRLVTRQVSSDCRLRARLQRIISAGGAERLCWAVSMPETPENHPPDLLVDAFSGEVLPPGAVLDVRATSPVELDE
jgi:hypothetical protein